MSRLVASIASLASPFQRLRAGAVLEPGMQDLFLLVELTQRGRVEWHDAQVLGLRLLLNHLEISLLVANLDLLFGKDMLASNFQWELFGSSESSSANSSLTLSEGVVPLEV